MGRILRQRQLPRRTGAALLLAFASAIACGPPAGDGPGNSADGIVYVRAVGGASDLARARIADGAVRPVTTTPDRDERWPHWSEPDGLIVYQVSPRGADLTSDLVLFDPKTRHHARFPPSEDRQERWAAWAPGGGSVVYAFRGGSPAAGVALVNLSSHTSRIVARSKGPGFFLRPSFSPDREWLAAELRHPAEQRSSIWRLSPTQKPRTLTSDAAWNDTKPYFTRDSSEIVFTRRRASGGPADVMRIPVDGGDAVAVVAGGADEHSARPSPTRDEIAFVADPDGLANMFLANLDGSGVRNLHPTRKRHLFAPRWSPDGERIAVTANDAGERGVRSFTHGDLDRMRVVVFDRAGNELLDTPGAMADWMPPWP